MSSPFLSPIIFNYKDITIDSINNIKYDYITKLEELNNMFLSIPLQDLCWNNFIKPLIHFYNTYTFDTLLNMKNFHKSEEIRTKCSEINSEIEQYNINNNMRIDLYNLYKYYYINTYHFESQNLSDEEKIFFQKTMKDFKKSGLELDDGAYERVKEIKNELSELIASYELNVDNYSKEFLFTESELDGLPQLFLDEHKTSNNMIKITLEYPDYIFVMTYCKNRDIRKQMNYEYKRRAYDTNVEIAEKVFPGFKQYHYSKTIF
jgi:Zn-dependent oligopeptidase